MAFSFLILFLFSSCDPDPVTTTAADLEFVKDQSREVPQEWMGLFLEVERYAKGYRPGPAPRALAYMNLAAYEACMEGMPDYKSVAKLYNGLLMPHAEADKLYHWPTVANAVYATMMKEFFPGNTLVETEAADLQFKILALEQKFEEEFNKQVVEAVFERSKAHGVATANTMLEWAATDQFGHEAYLNPRPNTYTPPSGPGLWQPTAPDYGAAMFPYWGSCRVFAITEADKLCKKPKFEYSNDPHSSFYDQAEDVKRTVDSLSFTEQWIAEFWSDDAMGLTFSPPSRIIAHALQILDNEDANLELALYAYAKVSIAINDAGVACWHSKYVYNLERPVSYIQREIDPNWLPHLPFTPAFPAYPSGHSTFAGVGAEVLAHIFGYDYAFTDYCHKDRTDFLGMPRNYPTLHDMARENAYSRIPLGVHFEIDCTEGLDLGYKIGRIVNEMPFKK